MATKSVKGGSVVLECKKGGEAFAVTADSFSVVGFDGVEVLSGVEYYVNKAKENGAIVKAKKAKKKAQSAD